eukprot:TRINITY_DN22924_c0_g1_i1.p1 TRINITY_DN22924_c0_g1~~TRINITY_DN22924_c0_g1_i1.p1  ORF type:complete len:316 (+),score=83.31 TRINITY_DN22924_c0_g1_i1:65-1012(+)
MEAKEEKKKGGKGKAKKDEGEDAPKKASAGRKKKDAEDPALAAIKKPTTAYFAYCKEKREEVKAQYNLEGKEVTTKLGELWRKMTDEEKKPYEDLVKQDKERYEREVQEKKLELESKGSSAAAAGDEDVENDDNEESSSSSLTSTDLPVARVKKILRMDDDVKNVGKEATFLITKAAELFLQYLGRQTARVTESHGKKTISPAFFDLTTKTVENLRFISMAYRADEDAEEIKPKEKSKEPAAAKPKPKKSDENKEAKESKEKNKKKRSSTEVSSDDGPKAKSAKITNFFAKPKQAEEGIDDEVQVVEKDQEKIVC